MDRNLTNGSVWNAMLRFSLPFLLSYFLQTLYGMADLFIIGQFCGVESTTAVAVGSQIMHMLTVMIVGLAMGSVVMIGQAVGAGDRKRIAGTIGNTVSLFVPLSLLLTGILLFAVDFLVKIMSTPQQAVPGTRIYLQICFLGIPFIVAYNMISAVFRGLGDSKTPMYFVAAACGMNIALDYLLIGGLHMGPAGAALGTVLSQTASVALSAAVISRRQKSLGLSRKDFQPVPKILKGILKIGVPVAIQDGFIQVAFLVITIFANLRGLQDAAAVGIVEKMIGIFFLVPSSMLQTVSSLSAQNMGAGKHERARKTLFCACLISLIWGAAVVLLMHWESRTLIGLFTDSREVTSLGCQYMRGYIWDCMFAGIHFSFSGYFCAYGYSLLSFLHNALSIVCVRIPLSYLAARYCSETLFPMGLASPAGSLLSLLICVAAYIWMQKRRTSL